MLLKRALWLKLVKLASARPQQEPATVSSGVYIERLLLWTQSAPFLAEATELRPASRPAHRDHLFTDCLMECSCSPGGLDAQLCGRGLWARLLASGLEAGRAVIRSILLEFIDGPKERMTAPRDGFLLEGA